MNVKKLEDSFNCHKWCISIEVFVVGLSQKSSFAVYSRRVVMVLYLSVAYTP